MSYNTYIINNYYYYLKNKNSSFAYVQDSFFGFIKEVDDQFIKFELPDSTIKYLERTNEYKLYQAIYLIKEQNIFQCKKLDTNDKYII